MPKVVFCIPSINGPFPATADALARHERRVRITRVVARAEPGELHYDVHGETTEGRTAVVVRR